MSMKTRISMAVGAASLAVVSFGVSAPGQALAGGANNGCGAYCPSGVGNPSGNGNATNQPGAGKEGKADSKFPPGQAQDGNDHNKGYECDLNQGVGKTNPAHSGCDVYSS